MVAEKCGKPRRKEDCCCDCKPKVGGGGNDDDKRRYTVKIHIDKSPRGKSVCDHPAPLPANKCGAKERKCETGILKPGVCKKQENSCQTEVCGAKTCPTPGKSHFQCQTIGKEYSHREQQTSICGGGPKCANKDCQTEKMVAPLSCSIGKGPNTLRQCPQGQHAFPFAGSTPSGHLKIRPNMVSYENKDFGILVANKCAVRTTVKRIVSCEEGEIQGKAKAGPGTGICCNLGGRTGAATSAAGKKLIEPKSVDPFYSITNMGKPRPQSQPQSPRPAPRTIPPPAPQNYMKGERNLTRQGIFYQPEPEYPQFEDFDYDEELSYVDAMSTGPESIWSSRSVHATHASKYEVGYKNSWKYVNPTYNNVPDKSGGRGGDVNRLKQVQMRGDQGSQGKGNECLSIGITDDDGNKSVQSYGFGQKEPRKDTRREVDRNDYVHSMQKVVEEEMKKNFASARNGPVFSGYGKKNVCSDDDEAFNPRGAYRHKDDGRRPGTQAGLCRMKSGRAPPSHAAYPPPPFPRKRMSDSEEYHTMDESGFHTPTLNFETDDFATNSTWSHPRGGRGGGGGLTGANQNQFGHKTLKKPVLEKVVKGSENKLHYVVKGAVDDGQQIRIGNTVLPVHNVVLEIHAEGGEGGNEQMEKVNHFSEFKGIPEEYHSIPPDLAKLLPRQEEVMAATKDYFGVKDPERNNNNINGNDGNQNRRSSKEKRRSKEGKRRSKEEKAPTPRSEQSGVGGEKELLVSGKDTIFEIVQDDKHEENDAKDKKLKALASQYNPKLFPGASGVLPNLDTQSGSVLVLGGINPQLPCSPENSGRDVYLYTVDVDSWTHVGLLPEARAHCGVAKVGIHVYLIGGTNPEEKNELGKNLAVQSNLRLNLRSGEWDELTQMAKPRSHFGCVAIGQRIYAIGGNQESRPSSSCEVFDTGLGKWSPIASMNSTRSNMGIAVLNGRIFVAGGTSKEARRILDTVMIYDPALDKWAQFESLPSPRAFCTLSVVRQKIYIVAGAALRDPSKMRNLSMPDVLCYSEVKPSWEPVGEIVTPRHGHSSAVVNDSIVIIGGVSSVTMGALNSVEVFSSQMEQVQEGRYMEAAKSGLSLVVL